MSRYVVGRVVLVIFMVLWVSVTVFIGVMGLKSGSIVHVIVPFIMAGAGIAITSLILYRMHLHQKHFGGRVFIQGSYPNYPGPGTLNYNQTIPGFPPTSSFPTHPPPYGASHGYPTPMNAGAYNPHSNPYPPPVSMGHQIPSAPVQYSNTDYFNTNYPSAFSNPSMEAPPPSYNQAINLK